MSKEELVSKLIKASNEIHKSKEYIPAGYINIPYVPLHSVEIIQEKPLILKFKDWLLEKQRKEISDVYGMNREAALIKYMVKDMAQAIDEHIVQELKKIK